MTYKDYQSATLKTWKASMNVQETLSLLGLGISGEIGEVLECIIHHSSIDELIKELGDVAYYIANLYNHLEEEWTISDQETIETDMNQAMYSAVIFASKLADLIKKIIHHGHELDKHTLLELANHLTLNLKAVASLSNISFDDCLQKNIEKLAKRYPNGFTTEDSITRKI